MNLQWPRGRFNGQPITGFNLRITVDLFRWYWLPKIGANRFAAHLYLHWLCVRAWAEPFYSPRDLRGTEKG